MESNSNSGELIREMPPSSLSHPPVPPPSSSTPLSPKTEPNGNGFLGKHRLTAAISNLQNQINSLQEELDLLETLGESSIVCKELISSVESIPDPLLPLSKGPTNVSWDRWFRGAQNSRKRWI